MEKDNNHSYSAVYSADVLEFVSIGTDFCSMVEQVDGVGLVPFVQNLQKSLSLLYLKGLSLSASPIEDDNELEHQVTEDDYNFIRANVASVLGSKDDYLDVFLEDMKYSDKPILKTVSEDVADIYQNIRNFIASYDSGMDEVMFASMAELTRDFRDYWGGRCLSSMRVLHEILFSDESLTTE